MNLYYPLGLGISLIKNLQNKLTVLGKRDGFGIVVVIADPLVKEIRQVFARDFFYRCVEVC